MPKTTKPAPSTKQKSGIIFSVDDREPALVTPRLRADHGIPAREERLKVGDYQTHDRDDELVLMTRKAADLVPSIYDGHLTDELEGCLNLLKSSGGGRLFFIQEGTWAPNYKSSGLGYFNRAGPRYMRRAAERGGSHRVLTGLWLDLNAAGAQIIPTADTEETVLALAGIYERAQEGWPTTIHTPIGRPTLKWNRDSRIRYLMGLWPRLREEQAAVVLKRWGSIKLALDTAIDKPKFFLENTPGLGKQGLSNLLGVLQGESHANKDS